MCRGNGKRDVTTIVTYSHASTPLSQSERAYYLSYFIKYFRRRGFTSTITVAMATKNRKDNHLLPFSTDLLLFLELASVKYLENRQSCEKDFGHTCYLPAGRSRSQFFTIRTDLSRQITCLFFSCSKLFLQPITNGFVYATLH